MFCPFGKIFFANLSTSAIITLTPVNLIIWGNPLPTLKSHNALNFYKTCCLVATLTHVIHSDMLLLLISYVIVYSDRENIYFILRKVNSNHSQFRLSRDFSVNVGFVHLQKIPKTAKHHSFSDRYNLHPLPLLTRLVTPNNTTC
jgi:hypothetical protein